MNRWLLLLYGVLTALAEPLLRRKLARRSRLEPGYSEAVDERFGHYVQPLEPSSSLVWLHAVSLGETRAAAVLINALRTQHPGLRLLLTHGTATGRAEGRSLLRPGDVQVWQPWDSPGAVARFFSHFKPHVGLLMETEVWPCTVSAARQRGIPLVLVNARLSDKSLRQALRLSCLSRPAYAALSAIYAQTADDARRFGELGVTANVFGNLKFDATPEADKLEQGKAWRLGLQKPVLVFASSREGEETELFKQISALAQAEQGPSAMNSEANLVAQTAPPGLAREAMHDGADQPAHHTTHHPAYHPAHHPAHYLVVPRHPQRFDTVAALALGMGLSVSRKSAWPASGPAASADALAADVWLGDSLGDMALYYSLADTALLGGSFEPLGGQNLIEAAACACPVVMGPHTFNFADAAAAAQAAGAAQRVNGLEAGLQAALAICGDPQTQQHAALAALGFAATSRGATQRTVDALRRFF